MERNNTCKYVTLPETATDLMNIGRFNLKVFPRKFDFKRQMLNTTTSTILSVVEVFFPYLLSFFGWFLYKEFFTFLKISLQMTAIVEKIYWKFVL